MSYKKRILVGTLVGSTNPKTLQKCKENIIIVRYSGNKKLNNLILKNI